MYDAIIVGAGLAGCSAAIHLASRGHNVLLLEKHHYPAHKLCGEFLSGESQSYLLRLGLLESVEAAGAREIRRARITTRRGRTFESRLGRPGYGISRFTLDHLLMVRAVSAGASVRQGVSVRSVHGDLDSGFSVETETETFSGRCVVGAYGKKSPLDRKLERPFLELERPFVAFKAHFLGSTPVDAVELHAFSGGYCGICPVEGANLNACWIGSAEALRQAGGDPDRMLENIQNDNAHLRERLSGLQRIPATFLATSQLYFRPKSAFSNDVCMLGDAAGLIAPMCGDGMSMALRSGELAVQYLDRFLRKRIDADTFRRRYGARWKREFLVRMQLGLLLHEGYSHERWSEVGIAVVRMVPALGKFLVRATRG